jgi:hypothetical protein
MIFPILMALHPRENKIRKFHNISQIAAQGDRAPVIG